MPSQGWVGLNQFAVPEESKERGSWTRDTDEFFWYLQRLVLPVAAEADWIALELVRETVAPPFRTDDGSILLGYHVAPAG